MHYYSHHIGDYQRDTASLSIVEHGAYRLLMDAYYVSERPLPDDLNALCRICRAMSKLESKAVADVVAKFFQPCADGLRHRRIDSEIASYQADAEKNRINGKKGGRPKKENPNETQEKPSGLFLANPNHNPNETQTITQTITQTKGNQYPITNNHTTSDKSDVVGRNAPRSPRLAVDDEAWLSDLESDLAYRGINIRNELGRMQRWCEVNRKQPSRQRFVNWLNRAERPISASGLKPPGKHQAYQAGEATRGMSPEEISKF